MYGVPPRGHLQGQTRDNSSTHFFTLNIYMCAYLTSVVYICRIIPILKGFTLYIIFLTHMECIHRWKFINNKKQEKWSLPITKTKHVQLLWEHNQNVTFNELKSSLKIGYNRLHICGVMPVFSVLVQYLYQYITKFKSVFFPK